LRARSGAKLAQAFARLGTQVELLELGPRILPQDEADAARGWRTRWSGTASGWRLGAHVTGASRRVAGKVLSSRRHRGRRR